MFAQGPRDRFPGIPLAFDMVSQGEVWAKHCTEESKYLRHRLAQPPSGEKLIATIGNFDVFQKSSYVDIRPRSAPSGGSKPQRSKSASSLGQSGEDRIEKLPPYSAPLRTIRGGEDQRWDKATWGDGPLKPTLNDSKAPDFKDLSGIHRPGIVRPEAIGIYRFFSQHHMRDAEPHLPSTKQRLQRPRSSAGIRQDENFQTFNRNLRKSGELKVRPRSAASVQTSSGNLR